VLDPQGLESLFLPQEPQPLNQSLFPHQLPHGLFLLVFELGTLVFVFDTFGKLLELLFVGGLVGAATLIVLDGALFGAAVITGLVGNALVGCATVGMILPLPIFGGAVLTTGTFLVLATVGVTCFGVCTFGTCGILPPTLPIPPLLLLLLLVTEGFSWILLPPVLVVPPVTVCLPEAKVASSSFPWIANSTPVAVTTDPSAKVTLNSNGPLPRPAPFDQ